MTMADHILAMDRHVLAHLETGEVVSCRDEFGKVVVLPVVFQNNYHLSDPDQPGVVSSSPALFCREEDLANGYFLEEGVTVLVNDVEYRVREPQADGVGGLVFRLLKLEESCTHEQL